MEPTTRAKGVAWAAIALLACGLCYSIGFQSGWNRGTDTANQQIDTINQSLHDSLLDSVDAQSARARGDAVNTRAG
jgi:hypothetical protein